MTDRELAECPFCGNSVVHVIPPTCKRDTPYNPADRAFPTVRCKCGAEVHGENWDESCSSAIAAWNRRTPSSEGDGRDAARYRWLRENAGEQIEVFQWLTIDTGHGVESVQGFLIGEQIDEAIDAAIAAAERKRAKE